MFYNAWYLIRDKLASMDYRLLIIITNLFFDELNRKNILTTNQYIYIYTHTKLVTRALRMKWDFFIFYFGFSDIKFKSEIEIIS